MDPLAESHFDQSAYSYVLNNPTRFIDPFGLKEEEPYDSNGNPIYKDWGDFDPYEDEIYLKGATITNYDKLQNRLYQESQDRINARLNELIGRLDRLNASSSAYEDERKEAARQKEAADRKAAVRRTENRKAFLKGNFGKSAAQEDRGVDWRGVGEASLGLVGGAAEIVAAAGTEWFSGGLATPVAVTLAGDGIVRVSFGGRTEARNLPSNLGGVVGMGVDKITGSTKGQKIGAVLNDVGTVILTGGTTGTLTTLFDPSVTTGMKVLAIGAQTGAYSDVLSNGGVYDRK